MLIDSHTHIYPPEIIAQRDAVAQREDYFALLHATPRARLASAENLVAALGRAGMARAVTFGFAFRDQGLNRLCNDYALSAARQHPTVLLPLAVVNPAAAGALGEARRALEAGARGLGELMPDGQGFALTDAARLDPLLELARAHGVPVLLHVNEPVGHTYPGKGSQGPAEAYALACRHPANTLIYAHWGGGLPFYELMPEVRAALSRVYYDTAASPYLYDAAVFAYAAAWVGNKILAGSDYPLLSPQRLLREARNAALTEEQRARILGGNAAALWQVEET